YKDVYAWDNNYGIYFGLVDRNGNNKTIIQTNNSIFNTTNIVKGCNASTVPSDYFNHFNGYSYSLSGYLKNPDGSPIADAYIYYYSACSTPKIYSTFSGGSGYFNLKSACPIDYVYITSVGKQTIHATAPRDARTYY